MSKVDGIYSVRAALDRLFKLPNWENRIGPWKDVQEVRGDSADAVLKVVSEKIAMWKAGAWGGPLVSEINESGMTSDG